MARVARQPRAVAVQLVNEILHAIVGLRDPSGRERVGLNDVRAGLGVGVVDVLDRLRLGEDQKVVVALLVAGASRKAIAAEVIFPEAKALDLRAHGPVENQDALARRFMQCGKDVAIWSCRDPKSSSIDDISPPVSDRVGSLFA